MFLLICLHEFHARVIKLALGCGARTLLKRMASAFQVIIRQLMQLHAEVTRYGCCFAYFGAYSLESVSGQAAQPVPLASLELSVAVHGQKLDG